MENDFRIITPIPDDNTCEAMVFGSAYKFAKSSKFFWDRLEHMIISEVEELKGQLIDREFCSYILNSPGMRSMIYRRSPPVSEPDKIKDLWTLRRISNLYSGLDYLDAMRKQNIMWSSMTGVREYVGKMMESGLSERQWKVAADGIDMPIEYETVRGILERDEAESVREADELAGDMEAHRMECERFREDLENYRRLNAGDKDGEQELPDLRILKEVDEGQDVLQDVTRSSGTPEHPYTSVPYAISGILESWVPDDVSVLIGSLESLTGKHHSHHEREAEA